jgi:hypothetical protein
VPLPVEGADQGALGGDVEHLAPPGFDPDLGRGVTAGDHPPGRADDAHVDGTGGGRCATGEREGEDDGGQDAHAGLQVRVVVHLVLARAADPGCPARRIVARP